MNHTLIEEPTAEMFSDMAKPNVYWTNGHLQLFFHFLEHFQLKHSGSTAIDTFFLSSLNLPEATISPTKSFRLKCASIIFVPFHRGDLHKGHFFYLCISEEKGVAGS